MSKETNNEKADLSHNHVYFSQSTLEIGVQNLGDLKELIANVVAKENELQEAVFKLSRYYLKINFQQSSPKDIPNNKVDFIKKY